MRRGSLVVNNNGDKGVVCGFCFDGRIKVATKDSLVYEPSDNWELDRGQYDKLTPIQALYREIGKRIQKQRLKLQLTQEEVSHLLHVNRVTIANMERGKHLKIETIFNFCEIAGINISEIIK